MSTAQERRRRRFERGLAPDDPRHGTVGGYTNWGCRCEDCSRTHLEPRKAARRAVPRGTEPLDLPGERWVPAFGWEGLYEVSSFGRVRSCDGRKRIPQIIKLTPARNYLSVSLCDRDREVRISVHRLVCASFHGAPMPGQVTRHLNGNPRDNRPENLRFGSGMENQLDRIEHGRNEQVAKTHCPRNHPYDEVNTYWASSGWRSCRTCKREANRRAAQRRRIASAASQTQNSASKPAA